MKSITQKMKFSLILTFVLVITSLMPILQLMVLYLNSFLLSPLLLIDNLSEGMSESTIFFSNAIFAVIVLRFYIKSKSLLGIILIGTIFILFMLPFLFYSTEKLFTDESPYFLQFMIIGLITGGILVVTTILKEKKSN